MGYHVRRCIEALKEQYMQATGNFTLNKNTEDFNKGFIQWLVKRNEISIYFIDLLDEYGYDFYDPNSAEIGKSEFDSIVLPYNNTIITPYADSFHEKYQDRVIDATFRVYDGIPAINTNNYLKVKHNNKGLNMFRKINNVLIHNPYNLMEASCFKDLQGCNSFDATIGVFGNQDDKDMNNKLQLLENQYKFCDKDSVVYDIVYDQDMYFGLITPKVKINKLKK